MNNFICKPFYVLMMFFVFSCGSGDNGNSDGIGMNDDNDVVVDEELVLVWSDEFDVDGAVSSANWTLETFPPNNGSWWNGEKQHYTDRLDNAFVSNGTLKIVAKKETFTIITNLPIYKFCAFSACCTRHYSVDENIRGFFLEITLFKFD